MIEFFEGLGEYIREDIEFLLLLLIQEFPLFRMFISDSSDEDTAPPQEEILRETDAEDGRHPGFAEDTHPRPPE